MTCPRTPALNLHPVTYSPDVDPTNIDTDVNGPANVQFVMKLSPMSELPGKAEVFSKEIP